MKTFNERILEMSNSEDIKELKELVTEYLSIEEKLTSTTKKHKSKDVSRYVLLGVTLMGQILFYESIKRADNKEKLDLLSMRHKSSWKEIFKAFSKGKTI